MAYLGTVRKQRKNAAARALAAMRMVKMTPEQRSQVARLGGYAKAEARRKAREAEAEEPEGVSA